MTSDILKNLIRTHWSHILFEYNGKECGVDPFSTTKYDVWCGDELRQVESVDEVMALTIFDGKSLNDIAEVITNIEL